VARSGSTRLARYEKVAGVLQLNGEQPAATDTAEFGAVIARYEQEQTPEQYSTGSAYKSLINNQIKPRWARGWTLFLP